MEGHQVPVKLGNVVINLGEIIFADNCGVIRIHREYEKEVIQKAIGVASTEMNIQNRILKQDSAWDIYTQEGEF